jgi:hypothetical protein
MGCERAAANDPTLASRKKLAGQCGSDDMSKFNPFGSKSSVRSAMDILQETFGIGIKNYDRGADAWNGEGWEWQPNVTQECVVEFSVNEGKGTGKQTIPASEFRDYVAVLKGIVDSGYKEREGTDRTAYVPTNVIAAQSFKMVYPRVQGVEGKVEEDKSGERNVVSVRTADGKGAKPMMVPRDQFAEVVNLLSSIADNLEQYEEQVKKNLS